MNRLDDYVVGPQVEDFLDSAEEMFYNDYRSRLASRCSARAGGRLSMRSKKKEKGNALFREGLSVS